MTRILLSIKELSEALNIPESTLYGYTRNSDFPCYRIEGHLRFDLQEVLKKYKRSSQNTGDEVMSTFDSLTIEEEIRKRGDLLKKGVSNEHS